VSMPPATSRQSFDVTPPALRSISSGQRSLASRSSNGICRPVRQSRRTRGAKKFGSATSVELDAIPARQLRALVRECIERDVDQEKLALLRVAEQSERELLTKWAATYGGTTGAKS